MTFFITGLICWGYAFLGEVKSGWDMLLITLGPVAVLAFFCVKGKKEPGPYLQSIFGQIILAGIFNGVILALLGLPFGMYFGILLNVILMFLVLYSRAAKLLRRKPGMNAYQRGYQDGAASKR